MMELNSIVVKESPGLCRCCLSEGCYKDLATEYPWMSETEVYADMLLECFDISITQNSEGPNGPKRLICEVCITRLRDACNFKKQVLKSEKKFVDMVARKHFQPKEVLVYEAHEPMKTEIDLEPMPGTSGDLDDVEYLEEDIEYVDDYREETIEDIQEQDITVSELEVKPKKSKKRSLEGKAEKKHKTQSTAISKYKDGKPLTETLWESLAIKRRHNLQLLFNFSSVIPFKWSKCFMCFYCDQTFKETESSALRKHTKYHGECFPDNHIINQVVKCNKFVKVDVSELSCELCSKHFTNMDDVIDHLSTNHDLEYVSDVKIYLETYDLQSFTCACCLTSHKTFLELQKHFTSSHAVKYSNCLKCGVKHKSKEDLKKHVQEYHAPGKFKCDTCDSTFTTLEGIDFHKDFFHDTVCEICTEVFPTIKLKSKHFTSKHPDFKCFACSMIFNNKTDLRKHGKVCYVNDVKNNKTVEVSRDDFKILRKNMFQILSMSSIIPFKWYMSRYRCYYCKLNFFNTNELRQHVVQKHEEFELKHFRRCKGEQGEVKVDISSIVCKQCSSNFDSLDSLTEHLIAAHNMDYDKSVGTSFQEFILNGKEIPCSFCTEKFAFFGNILKHINEKHFEKNFVCTYCGLFFCREVNLRAHISYKHGVAIQCATCSAEFINKHKLLLHMANNHGEKISKCTLCLESFTSPYVRAKHMAVKHNLQYKCKFCKKVFVKNSILQKHILKNHANEEFMEASTSASIDTPFLKEELKIEYDPDILSDLLNDEETPNDDVSIAKSVGETSRRKVNIQLVLNMSTAMPFKWFLSSFRCFYCAKNFNDPEDLKVHCSKEHFDYYDMKKAMKRYKGENITVKVDVTSLSCRICSAPMTGIEILIDHLIAEHEAVYDKSLTDCFVSFRLIKDNMACLICGENFTFFGHLLVHHNDQHLAKDHICSFCGLGFSKFVNLRAHISNHHRENSHSCTECPSTFQTRAKMLTHKARYHGTKISKCRECDESFTTPYLRSKHMVDKHNLEYKCPHCLKVFPKNSTMKTHIRRVHLREKNVQCSVCKDKFFDNALLRLHMVKHEGVRNFKCSYCGKTFLWLKNLRAHVKSHTKDLIHNTLV